MPPPMMFPPMMFPGMMPNGTTNNQMLQPNTTPGGMGGHGAPQYMMFNPFMAPHNGYPTSQAAPVPESTGSSLFDRLNEESVKGATTSVSTYPSQEASRLPQASQLDFSLLSIGDQSLLSAGNPGIKDDHQATE